MFNDYNIKYFTLDIPKNPIVDKTEWPIPPIGGSKIAKFDTSILTNEINQLFDEKKLIVDFVLLWTWDARIDGRDHYSIHSDGYYDDVKQRNCAMNWVISGNSKVEWWSHVGAEPSQTFKDDPMFKVTDWKWNNSQPIKLCEWTGQSPAVLNIKQPHSVKVIDNTVGPRKSVTIRFKGNPTIDYMRMLFLENVIDTN